MKKTAKEAARQRKIYMILIIILIIVLTVLGGGYYFMMQTKAASQKTSGKNSDDQSRTSQTSGSDTVEYKGGTYKYNDHLSNYLFLGIDTRNSVDTYQTQEDAGQADAIFVVSMDRATEEIKVLFIPRDSMTEIEVFNPSGKSLGESTDHINIQYAFGDGKQKSCELMKTAVSNLLDGLPIQGYCSMNMDGQDLPVWFDKYSIPVGASITEQVQRGIEESDMVIFWVTDNFLNSNWCQMEMKAYISRMIQENIRICIVMDDDIEIKKLPLFLRDIKHIRRDHRSVIEVAEEIAGIIKHM